jgi:hypothetical protein
MAEHARLRRLEDERRAAMAAAEAAGASEMEVVDAASEVTAKALGEIGQIRA